ncbi:MAG: glycosyltransferase family 2 protein [Deltaproteobacteria bacterium]|nr:glycosyltransferase family 2 protein [Deltaproteobacteria bacterium]
MPDGPGEKPKLSATVIAQDEEERLPECIRSLAFCDEVLVVDGGSRDRTREVAAEAGARVIERPFDDFASQHEFARAQARGEWIIWLDADERATPELAREVREVIVRGGPPAAFRVPTLNFWRDVRLRFGDAGPERHLRLFCRELCRFDPERPVHEKVVLDGPVGGLKSPIIHLAWRSLSHLACKSLRYAEDWARARHARGRRATALDVAIHPAWRFIRAYFFRLGFLDGVPGAILAFGRAYEAFARYARLWELSRYPDSKKDSLR